MYALLITATGWTWEYIDEFVTLPRLEALRAHWKSNPPVHVSVAAFLGFGKEAVPTKTITHEDIAKAITADPRKLQWISVPNENRHG